LLQTKIWDLDEASLLGVDYNTDAAFEDRGGQEEGAGRAKDAAGRDEDGAAEPAAWVCLSALGAAASLTRARLGTSRRTPISDGKARKQRWRGGKESAANQEGVHAVGEVGERRTMARIGEARPWAPRNSLEEGKNEEGEE
jgi:hypothetical protein